MHQDFTKFREEDRIRFLKEQAASTPSTTKLPPSHTSRKKIRPVFLSKPVDIFDEPNCYSTNAILLEKDEHDPSPSPTVKSPTNLLGTKRAFTRVHSTFPEDSKKLITEEHKDVKMIPATQHSTIGNHQSIPQPKSVHTPDIYPSPDDLPQDVDKSHLSESTSTTTNLNETCSLNMSFDYLLHLESPSLSSELQDNSIVESTEPESVLDFEDLLQLDSPVSHLKTHPALKLNLFLNLKDNFTMPTFHQQIVSLNTMTMNCSYYKRRLMHHMAISVIRKLMYVKIKVKMNSSSMPLTLATTLHYPNSWNNTTVKTLSPLILQVHFQPLPKLPVITPPIKLVLIIQWQPSAINPSTPPC